MHYHCSGNTRSLYIHWPFCPYRCHYCPFVALASHDQFMERYHKILTKEIIQFADQQNKLSRSASDLITKLNEKDIKILYPFQRKKLPLDTI